MQVFVVEHRVLLRRDHVGRRWKELLITEGDAAGFFRHRHRSNSPDDRQRCRQIEVKRRREVRWPAISFGRTNLMPPLLPSHLISLPSIWGISTLGGTMGKRCNAKTYPTETVLSNKITTNRIDLSFKDSPRNHWDGDLKLDEKAPSKDFLWMKHWNNILLDLLVFTMFNETWGERGWTAPDSSQLFDCSVTIQSRERGEWRMPFLRAPSCMASWCSIFLIVKVTNSKRDNLPHILFTHWTEPVRLKGKRKIFTQLWVCKGWHDWTQDRPYDVW